MTPTRNSQSETLHKALLILLFIICIPLSSIGRQVQMKHMYIFGFSASFKDTTVYITEVQDLQNVWYDTKTKFLIGRDNYSYQLRDFLSSQYGLSSRVCLVVFDKSRKSAEKKLTKMKKKYGGKSASGSSTPGNNSLIILREQDFKFIPVEYNQ